MKKNSWGKTLLQVYPYLEKIAGAIDKILLKTALNSFYYTSTSYEENNVFNISNKLIDLGERKVTLINLKILIEEALKNMKEEQSALLIEKYVERKKFIQLAKSHNICMRTAFRKVDAAEESFAKSLNKLGYDDGRLLEFLKNETWILNVHKVVSKGSEDTIQIGGIIKMAVV